MNDKEIAGIVYLIGGIVTALILRFVGDEGPMALREWLACIILWPVIAIAHLPALLNLRF